MAEWEETLHLRGPFLTHGFGPFQSDTQNSLFRQNMQKFRPFSREKGFFRENFYLFCLLTGDNLRDRIKVCQFPED